MEDQKHYCVKKIKEMRDELGRIPMISDFTKKYPLIKLEKLFGSYDNLLKAAGLFIVEDEPKPQFRPPKIGILDIETKPMKVWAFGLFDQNIGIDMIIEDWSVMSWAFKWHGSDEVFYQDLSENTDYTKDEIICYGIWELINEADIIITQNGKRFDIPKLNGKFTKYGIGLPSPYQHIDTLQIKRKLGLTSKKLAYSTEYYNEKYKKLSHGKFPGISLWLECLKGNQDAWAEMKQYNIHDVLSLEELYFEHLIACDNSINYGVYTGSMCCKNCGCTDMVKKDLVYTKTGAFQVYQCSECQSWSQSKHNELSRATTKNLLK